MSNRMKLEVDPSIFERNLDFRTKILKDDDEGDDPLSRLFPRNKPKEDEIPWKAVMPNPGFVAKLRTLEGDKVFINVCHSDEVPSPKNITEEELVELLNSDDPSTFTVPMSMGDLHVETDKTGNLASAYDIAISTEFFNKIQENILFKDFFVMVIMEGVEEKHKLQIDRENKIVILKNRKCLGTLQSHRIQQRPVRSPPVKLIQELPDKPSTINSSSSSNNTKKRPLIEELPDSSLENNHSYSDDSNIQLPVNTQDRLRLIKIPKTGPAKKLIAFISISALSGKELELDVGEDRILVNSPRKHELVDFFLPYNVDRDGVTAKYLVNNQTLRVELPVKD